MKVVYNCDYCKDVKFVQIAPHVRGIKRCPYCNNEKSEYKERENKNANSKRTFI